MPEQYPELVKVFVRHAKSVNNERSERGIASEDRVGGYQPKVELSQYGKEQARIFGGKILACLSELLKAEAKIVRFSVAPARRTRLTATLAHTAMGVDIPLQINPRLHELRKGNMWLGGDEKRLRSKVETPAYRQRREQEGWDFRPGRPLLNRIGLGKLSGAETPREAGSRVVEWLQEVPDELNDFDGEVAIDMAVSHGLAGRYGIAMLLHSNPEIPDNIEISVQDADRQYKLPNASAFILSQTESGVWVERGRFTTEC